jgi:NADH-quinone oxidoreductase subunit E
LGNCAIEAYGDQGYSRHHNRPPEAPRSFKLHNYPIAQLLNVTMKFSEQFEQRFSEMLTHYPTKRSVLVPTLLYAQDETGYLSDEVIEEIASRLELTALDVRNVISYYSMLTTKPRGKYNVQVCTNIACMLRGGEELLEHCEKKLGIGHKGTTPDGVFTLEEVECIGACSWAPAVQVNYDFHENLTTEKMDRVLEEYRRKIG